METSDVAGIILAVAPHRPEADHVGQPVLASVVQMVESWGLALPVVTVFSHDTEHLLESVDLGSGAAVVDQDGTSRGSALSVGLDAVIQLHPEAEAAAVVDSDVPAIPAGTVQALVSELSSSGSLAAAPQYRYVRGGPVVIGRQLWDRIMASDSDQRLDDLLAAHPEWTSTVVFSERAPTTVS